MMIKILIIGASGLVGSALMHWADEYGFDPIGTYFSNFNFARSRKHIFMDITHPISETIHDIQPYAVFIPAGNHNVDWCEQNEDEAYRINVAGVKNILEAAKDSKIVFYSSSYVFDGSQMNWAEDDDPSPLNVYGKHKVLVESEMKHGLTIRTIGVFGMDKKNFISQMVRKAKAGEEAIVPNDQWVNPISDFDLAKASYELLLQGATGIVHVAGGVYLTKYQWAQSALQALGYRTDLLRGVQTSELNQPAPRPLGGGLRTYRMSKEFGMDAPYPQRSLELLGSYYDRL